MFKDVQFMTAKEKELVLNSWKNFLRNLLEGNGKLLNKSFTERLYSHLMQHCSFIAHYDRGGFFQTYFVDPEDSVDFFQQFDKDKDNRSFEYGDGFWLTNEPYSDINKALCDEFEKVKMTLYDNFKAQAKEGKLAEIRRLRLEVAEIGATEQQQTL